MKNVITAPSGLKAKVLLPGKWGPNKESAGLKYVGKKARSRLLEVFTQRGNNIQVLDIAADMKAYKFGYVDGIDIDPFDGGMEAGGEHVFPMTLTIDNMPNCLWHSDNLIYRPFAGEQRVRDTSPVTFLYPTALEGDQKRTGFAHPAAVADAYNALHASMRPDSVIEPTLPSIRAYADLMSKRLLDLNEDDPAYATQMLHIESVLFGTYHHLNALMTPDGGRSVHWLRQKLGRLMVLSNESVVHSNDLVRNYRRKPRPNQHLVRRMLPGIPWQTHNRPVAKEE